jgi:hypothetical protein
MMIDPLRPGLGRALLRHGILVATNFPPYRRARHQQVLARAEVRLHQHADGVSSSASGQLS